MKSFTVGNVKLLDATKQELHEHFCNIVSNNIGGLITFSSTHTVVLSYVSPDLLSILNSTQANCPDGKPLTWGSRGKISTHRGTDFFRETISDKRFKGVKMLVLGGAIDKAMSYRKMLEDKCNVVVDLDYECLQELNLSKLDLELAVNLIRKSRPKVVWLSLGSPKQEFVSFELMKLFPGIVFINIGAALDFFSGIKKEAPMWMRGHSIEWIFRALQEPRRLWRRYLFGNSAYLLYFVAHRFTRESISDKKLRDFL